MNDVKLLHIKCCFFQFFNSPVAFENKKIFLASQEKVEMTPPVSISHYSIIHIKFILSSATPLLKPTPLFLYQATMASFSSFQHQYSVFLCNFSPCFPTKVSSSLNQAIFKILPHAYINSITRLVYKKKRQLWLALCILPSDDNFQNFQTLRYCKKKINLIIRSSSLYYKSKTQISNVCCGMHAYVLYLILFPLPD